MSLTCAGDSAEWTVNRFSSYGYLTHCATWGSMTGPTCYINGQSFIDGVYWCETATGLFSNAVNITGTYNDAIVDFPVHPVTEGQPVTLRCKWTTELNLAVISFYKNDKLIQNDTRGEFFIPAVSKSDEGFYKCGRKGRMQWSAGSTSPASWMSIKDVQSAATLSVSPDRAQHFITDTMSLSLTCAGDSAEWTVNRFSSSGYLTRCATWGSMTGPTCYINGQSSIDGVYWCETATGLFSNAVNISGTYNNAIVDFPVHPVTEGQPVTLRCKWTTELNLAVISFYKNDKLIQNDTRGEFFIPAVSKSDEGFYKCGRKGRMQRSAGSTSPASWMSIKGDLLTDVIVILMVLSPPGGEPFYNTLINPTLFNLINLMIRGYIFLFFNLFCCF
uniref:Ig-like domain-containing protein n=1 Tax=Takifugu rubripes TaxID=31033 RepID=A0A674NI29_TAKRU